MENLQEKIFESVKDLLQQFTPTELEDVFFDIFERANLHSEGDLPETRESRVIVHHAVRNILRMINKDASGFNKILYKKNE